MRIVVTGSIGCGKTTVVSLLANMLPRMRVVDFDKVVHSAYEQPELQAQLTQLFGTCERSQISNVVHTADPSFMAQLNAIVEPFILGKFKAAAANDNVILDVPLWFEYAHEHVTGPFTVICVTAPLELQLSRVLQRSGFSHEKTMAIINKQLPQQVKSEMSDFTIVNDGEYANVVSQVTKIVNDLNTA